MPRPASISRVLRAVVEAREQLAAWEATDTQLALAAVDLEDAMTMLAIIRHELRERRKGAARG